MNVTSVKAVAVLLGKFYSNKITTVLLLGTISIRHEIAWEKKRH
jgi:hypothetical protein